MVAEETTVVIVGAGQSGLATAACLAERSVPYIVLERDDCIASLWRNRCYDRVCLHLSKKYCWLPGSPHPPTAPAFLSKWEFIRYLDDYAARFRLRVRLRRRVEAAEYDEAAGRWRIAVDASGGQGGGGEAEEYYTARYLVVATGENDEPAVPEIPGLEGFGGPVVHSSRYRTGSDYAGKAVLVVGSGNSGMEVALDLAEHGARRASIVVKSPLHVVSKEIWAVALAVMRIIKSDRLLDALILFLCYLKFGNLSKYGLHRPSKGPMYLKKYTPAYPVVDIGTIDKIKSGEIKVVPSVRCIKGNLIAFSDGSYQEFDAIILATGYRSTVKKWLKGDEHLIGEDGMAKQMFPNSWKGKRGLYCAGLSRKGIPGSAEDASSIADDIASHYHSRAS